MKKVYLDNASTTALRPEVIQEITHVLQEEYGNPSSTHSFGRSAKNILESSRKLIAKQLNASAQEIIFTSGGTEANNWILRSAIKDLKVKRIITSKIEHHAVLNTVLALQTEYGVEVDFVNLNSKGEADINHLVELLSQDKPTLVALMHVNNETGTVLDIEKVARLCKQYNALFHSDTVQSVGKTEIDLQKAEVDFIVASAHKFHGPKGMGFAFIRKNAGINPMIFGGEQEKGLRAGTEDVHNIAGMAKALEISYANLEAERRQIRDLKDYFVEKLQTNFPEFKINGNPEGFYNIINVLLPFSDEKTAMILFNLDMKGIAVSRGSACQSGSIKPSHVLKEMLSDEDLKKPSLRISFSHFNTSEDIDLLIEALKAV
ncbi:cysteine desulfurase [Flavobacterium sp. Leaf359]|uniref:cysteine desulfurase family protein n=1 Tax=Flavobacterium sp. Leaf359 TaxID=1736351 RepID=UPI00070090C2|nr:cysteine desulfurase family protein [Flavobacterium sp. Leaf359]KQS47757.1 cysteine desulfurase [Flavobacterium sp. Leaf359]PZQ86102.1 MAG: cysteine desulfurase [Flavobacterium johnsoniae]